MIDPKQVFVRDGVLYVVGEPYAHRVDGIYEIRPDDGESPLLLYYLKITHSPSLETHYLKVDYEVSCFIREIAKGYSIDL